MDFSGLGSALEGVGGQIKDQQDQAFKLKLMNAQIEAQARASKDLNYLSPEGTARIGELAGGGKNIYSEDQRISPQEASLFGGIQKAQIGASSRQNQRPTIKGDMIMRNLPDGESLGLDPNGDYPYSMATFALSATRQGMGTADMKNQLVGINSFEKSLQNLKQTYDSFEPGNPLVNTIEEKWASLVKGWSSRSASDQEGSAELSGIASELQNEVTRDADNAEVADMLIRRIELAMEYARATNGARPSDKDFLNALMLIPSYSQDSKLRDMRFNSLAKQSEVKREAILKQAPKLRTKEKEEEKSSPFSAEGFRKYKAQQDALKESQKSR